MAQTSAVLELLWSACYAEKEGTERVENNQKSQARPKAFKSRTPPSHSPFFPSSIQKSIMGRRKIEIQPITHERNRSVTFLKRKNGLFKKAYELGVLCSVDVAVIIFEEKPGHHLKLYQYCSSDIREIVERHVRYEGEKETRVPADFSGNPAHKLDDLGEGDDDDDGEDDHDIPIRGGNKRRGDNKLKPPGDMGMGGDMDYMHTRLAIPPPPMPMHDLPSGSTTLPISRDRHSALRGGNAPPSHHSQHGPHKKPRIAPISHSHSRSSSDDNMPNPPSGGSSGGGYPYHQSNPPSFRQQHPGSQYSGFFPISTQTPPTPSFIPPQFDFPPTSGTSSSRGPPPSSQPRSAGAGSGFPGRGSYDQGMYQQMIRPPQHSPHSAHPHHPQGASGGGGGGGGDNLFAAFLDADEHSRQNQSQAPGFGLDWPVHGGPGQPGQSGGSSVPTPTQVNPPSSASSSGNDNNWLDFLSGNGPNSTANPGAGAPPPSGRSEPMSWERGDRHHDLPELFGDRSTSGRTLTSPLLAKGPMGSAGRSRGGSGGESTKHQGLMVGLETM
ncbi:hypothetical protein BD779DRAFT_1664564 [Infundibulicybe gibba]|nr:hypothetical protein BD779DRAFT_1664564 [Infundibulicybe gibba]